MWRKILPVLLLLAFIPSVNAYPITYHVLNHTTNPQQILAPSFLYPYESCSVNMTLRGTSSGPNPYTLSAIYYSPDSNIVNTIAPTEFSNNFTCHNFGAIYNFGATTLNEFYETSINTTYNGYNFETWLEAGYNCNPDSNDMIIISNTTATDYFGNYPFSYGTREDVACGGAFGPATSTNIGEVADRIRLLYTTDCYDSQFELTRFGNGQNSCANPNTKTSINYFVIVPVWSGPSGYINVSYIDFVFSKSSSASCTPTNNVYDLYLYDIVQNSTTTLGSSLSLPHTTQMSVIPNRQYFIIFASQGREEMSGATPCSVSYNRTTYNISIFAYEPNWVCGAYGECIDGVKTRQCNDTTGVIPSKTETITCALGVLENATIGFTEFEEVQNTICTPQYEVLQIDYTGIKLFSCHYKPLNITVERPKGWFVQGDATTFNRYFLKMSNDFQGDDGSRSVKMWNIPMKDYEPISQTECGNTTGPNYAVIGQNISNHSFSVGFNVTFPAENMRLHFEAKRCENQVLQHGDVWNVWNWTLLCPEVCYSNNCSSQPEGSFVFNMKYANGTNTPQFPKFYTLNDNRRHIFEFDLTTLGLNVVENYTLLFAPYQENYLDTDGNCFYIDNIRYDVLDNTFLSILGGVCQSRCVENDYYTASEQNGVCFVTKEVGGCDSEHDYERENLLDYCYDSTTLYRFDSLIADYMPITCDVSCQEGECVDTIDSTSTPSDLETVAGLFGDEYAGFFTFTFISLLVIIGSMLLVFFKSDQKDGGVILSLAVGLVLTIALSLPNIAWLPVEVGLIVGIGLTLFLVYELRKLFLNG